MVQIRVEVPDEDHTAIKDIKNHNGKRPDTIKGCVLEAIDEYVERHNVDR